MVDMEVKESQRTRLKTSAFIAALIMLLILALSMPSDPDRVATTPINGTTFSVSVELYNAHPFLAEYERVLVFRDGEEVLARAEIFKDGGGFDEVYLFHAGPNAVYLIDVVDVWKLDLSKRLLIKQDIPFDEVEDLADSLEYVGKFAGAGSRPWRFEPAAKNERPIMKRIKGG